MPYGYLGQTPNQQVKNSGVFSVGDAKALTDVGQLGGSLELIQEQVITSSTSAIDFTNLGNYDVHFLSISGVTSTLNNKSVIIQLSNDGGSSFITSGYQYAHQVMKANGSFTEVRSTSGGQLVILQELGNAANDISNSYCYLYNLSNSSKYSFATQHTTGLKSATEPESRFGGGVLPTAEIHNAIRIREISTTDFDNATAKLYGVKQIWVT